MEKVYLSAIRMINCQSHTDTMYEFAQNKVNVIAADNGVGKSVFFKMLQMTLLPRRYSSADRLDVIRHGCECAGILYAFSDGSCGAFWVYKNGYVYQFRESAEEEMVTYNDVPEELLVRLNVLMDANAGFITNYLDVKQSLLLVDNSLQSNYHLLKLIASNETIDKMLEMIPEKIEKAERLHDALDGKLNYVRQRYDSIQYCDENELRWEIESLEAKNQMLSALSDVQSLLHVFEESAGLCKDYDSILAKCDTLKDLLGILQRLDNIVVQEEFNYDLLAKVVNTQKVVNCARLLAPISVVKPIDFSAISSLDLCARLLKLFDSITIDSAEDYDSALSAVEIVHELIGLVDDVLVVKEPADLEEPVSIVDSLLTTAHLLGEVSDTSKGYSTAKEDYDCVKALVREKNAVIKCGIYGEVMFDGEHCHEI